MGLVYVVLGILMSVASMVVGYIIVFAEPAVMPLGQIGKFILVVVILGVNGILVVWVASLRSKVQRQMPKI